MKNILFVLALVFGFTAQAQEQKLKPEEVPAVVKAGFKTKFPGIKDGLWVLNKGQYEVEFMEDSRMHEGVFNAAGEWIETEMEISKSEVPELVMNAFKASAYKDLKIKETEMLSTPEYKTVFELELKKGKEMINVLYLPDGKFVKETKE